MIEIVQQRVPANTFANTFTKMDEVSINMNKELIQRDIDRLKEMSENPKNRYDAANIKALITYLNKLLKNILEDSTFEMCWEIKDNLPDSYPIRLINEKAYGIDICNYIEVSENEKLVQLDITSLADIISFEIMARDLGESHESIEELLKECGIIGFEPASLLTDYFKENEDNVYKLSKSMKIGETPYYSYEDRKVHDYFSSKEFKTKEYRDVVEYSCKYASAIIANTIVKNSIHCNIDIKVVMLNATNITFIVNDTDEFNIKNNIIEEISVRAFGRKFKIEPDIQIF